MMSRRPYDPTLLDVIEDAVVVEWSGQVYRQVFQGTDVVPVSGPTFVEDAGIRPRWRPYTALFSGERLPPRWTT